MVWGAQASFPCSSFVCVAGWLSGWGHLPVCVLLVCLCLGEVSRGPLPMWPSLCLCRSPKARTLSVCSSSVVLSQCVCVCVSWCCGLCVSVPMWLCYSLSESAPSMCPFGGVYLSIPLLVLCPRLEREDSATAPPINLCSRQLSVPVLTRQEGKEGHATRVTFHSPPTSYPAPPPSLPSNIHAHVGQTPPVPLLPSPTPQPGSLAQGEAPRALGLVAGESWKARSQGILESHS